MNHQFNFFSADCHARYKEQGYSWIEMIFNGHPLRISFGFQAGQSEPSIHIIGPIGIRADQTAINSLDIKVPKKESL